MYANNPIKGLVIVFKLFPYTDCFHLVVGHIQFLNSIKLKLKLSLIEL